MFKLILYAKLEKPRFGRIRRMEIYLGLPLYVTMIFMVFLALMSSDCFTAKSGLSTDSRNVVGTGNVFLN